MSQVVTGLQSWPDRVLQAPPTGRLHIVDLSGFILLSNRFGTGVQRRRQMGGLYRAVVRDYIRAVKLKENDAALVLDVDSDLDGDTPVLLLAPLPSDAWRPALRLTPECCAERYNHVLIASCTGRLVSWVTAIRAVGLPVTLVHRPGLAFPGLAELANTHVSLPRLKPERQDPVRRPVSTVDP